MSDPQGWILYDDACGFCRKWVPFWESTLTRRGFAITPLQADWVIARLAHLDEPIDDDIRLLLADGTLINGADAYRYALRRIWWAWPLYLVSVTPVTRRIFDWAYRGFARRRFKVSRACGLDGGPGST